MMMDEMMIGDRLWKDGRMDDLCSVGCEFEFLMSV